MTSRSRLGALGASALVLAVVACSTSGRSASDSAAGAVAGSSAVQAASQTADTSPTIPPAIEQVGAHGEALYDAAKVGQWSLAAASLDSLRTAIAQLPGDVASDTKASLTALADSLGNDIRNRQALQAQMDANLVTYASADLLRSYVTTTPVQVVLLDCEGRDLEIWVARNDAAEIRRSTQSIRRTWNEVRSQVAARDPAQALRTDRLVTRIEKTQAAADLRLLTTPFLDDVDQLEKVFTRQ